MSRRKPASVRKVRARDVARKPNPRKNGGSLACPDCDFVAKHVMGLGRHRTARHGALSARAQREASNEGVPKGGRPPKDSGSPPAAKTVAVPGTPKGWVTRRQAADLGGVHYNTVMLWERANLFPTRQRGRKVLIDEAKFRALLEKRKAAPKGRPVGAKTKRYGKNDEHPSAARVGAAQPTGSSFDATQLLARVDALANDLADGLESLARLVRPRKRRGRPPKRG